MKVQTYKNIEGSHQVLVQPGRRTGQRITVLDGVTRENREELLRPVIEAGYSAGKAGP